MVRAVGTAKDAVAFFHPVADNPATTMGAARRQFLDGAFKAVEYKSISCHRDLERLVVVVATNIAFSHCHLLVDLSPAQKGYKQPGENEQHEPGNEDYAAPFVPQYDFALPRLVDRIRLGFVLFRICHSCTPISEKETVVPGSAFQNARKPPQASGSLQPVKRFRLV